MNARAAWAARCGAFALFFLLLWDTPLVRPFRALVVLFHEIFHALAALLTGGGAVSIRVLSARAGSAEIGGGLPAAVLSAGLLGTALLGAVLVAAGPRYPLKRSLYLGLAALLAVSTLLFVRSPFGWAYGLTAAAVFLLPAFFELPLGGQVTDFVGVLCLLDAARDLLDFSLRPGRNDAMILHELTGLPYPAVLAGWAAAVLALGGAAFALAWRSRAPARLERNLQWGEFRLITRRGALRRRSMTDNAFTDGRGRGRGTVAVYLGVLAALGLFTLYASRFILFHPWTARNWVAGAAVEGRIYLAGGRDDLGDLFDALHRIDPDPPARLSPPAAAAPTAAAAPPTARIRRAAVLPSPRFGAAAAAAGGRLFIAGGFDGRRCSDDLLVFDPATGRLQRLAALPGPRAFGAMTVLDGRLFYLGGWDGEKQLDEILAVDPESGRAQRIGRLPSARESAAAAALGGRLYLAGGADGRGRYLDEVLEIDPRSGAVLRAGRLPSGRARLSAAAVDEDIATLSAGTGGAIYLAGGWDGQRRGEVLRVRPAAGEESLRVEPFARLAPGSADAALVAAGGRLYLLGGTDARFQRQLRAVRLDPESGRAESLRLRSFLWW